MEIFLDQLTTTTNQLSNIIAGPLVFILLGTGLFITITLRFIQFKRLKHSFNVVRGKYDDPSDEGDVTHFQALSTALSSTIGIGNIAGVALAMRLGGPGALFWMWVTALLGMATKYAECTLSLRYRDINKVPHPTIKCTIDTFDFNLKDRNKIYFTHLNHTNKVLMKDSEAYNNVISKGFNILDEKQKFEI